MAEIKGRPYGLRALIIDDDFTVRGYLGSTLRLLGCPDVLETWRDVDVLAACRQHRPDIIFLDIELGSANGLDLIGEILQQRAEQFIVILSGHGTVDNVRVAMANGASGFIVKPFSIAKIEQALRNALERKSGLGPVPVRVAAAQAGAPADPEIDSPGDPPDGPQADPESEVGTESQPAPKAKSDSDPAA